MKTLLVPTDFSPTAENALLFAILLARKEYATIHLINAYENTSGTGKHKMESEHHLRSACMKIQHAGGVPYEYAAVEGIPAEVILDQAKKRGAEMIIMGTNGDGSFGTAIFGSTASAVIGKASCPVLAIPAGASFHHPIRKITFATDYHLSDIDAIQVVAQLARTMSAQLNVMHISSGGDISVVTETELMEKFKNSVIAKVEYSNMSFQMLHGETIRAAMEEHLAEGNTDMMVMSTHIRGLIENIFGDSLTRRMALKGGVPLLVFHFNPHSSVKLY